MNTPKSWSLLAENLREHPANRSVELFAAGSGMTLVVKIHFVQHAAMSRCLQVPTCAAIVLEFM